MKKLRGALSAKMELLAGRADGRMSLEGVGGVDAWHWELLADAGFVKGCDMVDADGFRREGVRMTYGGLCYLEYYDDEVVPTEQE